MPIHNATSRPFYDSQPFVKLPPLDSEGGGGGSEGVGGMEMVMAHKL